MFCTLFGHMSHIPNVCVSAQCINKENFVICCFYDAPLVINTPNPLLVVAGDGGVRRQRLGSKVRITPALDHSPNLN